MTKTATNSRARLEYATALGSLAAAEDLLDMLRSNKLGDNCYYFDALHSAEMLVDEMDRNLQDVMDRFTPEQCGVDLVDGRFAL